MFKKVKENKCLISVNVLWHLFGFLFLFLFMSTVTARENANSPNDTLAIIGDKIISVSDFIRSYNDNVTWPASFNLAQVSWMQNNLTVETPSNLGTIGAVGDNN